MTELLICTLSIVLAPPKISMKEGLIGVIKGELRVASARTARKQPHSHY